MKNYKVMTKDEVLEVIDKNRVTDGDKATIKGALIEDMEFDVNFHGTCFKHCRFVRVKLDNCCLSTSIFEDCCMMGVSFSGAFMQNTVFSNTVIEECWFCKADLSYGVMLNCMLRDIDMKAAKLSYIEWNDMLVDDVSMCNCTLEAVKFVNINGDFWTLKHTVVKFSEFTGLSIHRLVADSTEFNAVRFFDVKLPWVTISSSEIVDSALRANLSRATIIKTTIRSCNLMSTDLSYSDITNSIIKECKMCRANMTGVDISGTQITDSDMTLVTMRGYISNAKTHLKNNTTYSTTLNSAV